MAGPPVLRITAKAKQGHQGKPLKVAAGWQGKYGYSVKLEKGVTLTMPDGTVVADDFWINLDFTDRPRTEGGGSRGSEAPAPAPPVDPNDIPF